MMLTCSSESQLQRDKKRQKTYEFEASEQQKNVQAAAEFWAVMRQTHGFQNLPTGPQVQSASTNEVAPSTEPGTPPRHPAETLLESLGNTKRRRGSDEEYTKSTNHPLDTIPARPAKRRKEFTGEYANPITTASPQGDTPVNGSGYAAPLTTNESEKSILTNATFQPIAQTTHGFQTRVQEAHDIVSLTDTSRSQPDTKKCIQVGSETYAVMSQPRL